MRYVVEGQAVYTRGEIVLSWLCSTCCQLPRDADMETVVTYTKAYVLFVIGKVLFTFSNRDVVHARYILFLRDIDKICTYAWEAAVLACLYRSLHKATRIDAKNISGYLTFL